MNTVASIKVILIDVLQLSSDLQIDEETNLVNVIPEFDESAISKVISAIEDVFGVSFEEDEIERDVFEEFGSLCDVVMQKLDQS